MVNTTCSTSGGGVQTIDSCLNVIAFFMLYIFVFLSFIESFFFPFFPAVYLQAR